MRATVKPINRDRLHDRITRDLALNFIRGDLCGKQELFTETDLARQMSVSRTALRESVKVLAAKGLIVVRPKTGLRVRPREDWNMLDPELLAWLCETGMDDVLVRDLCEVRLLMEPAAAELAAARATQKETEGILECYRQMQQNSENPNIYDPLDIDFHNRIFQSCHNAFVAQMNAMMTETLRATQNAARRLHSILVDKSLALHGEVAQAIQQRDCLAARLSMERIVKQAASDLSQSLSVKITKFTNLTWERYFPVGVPFQPKETRSQRRLLRGLQRKDLAEKRVEAVRLVESGVSPEHAAKQFGMNRTTVYDWLARYRAHGQEGLRSGLIPGRPPALTPAQKHSLLARLEANFPRIIGSSSSFWTDVIVRDLLQAEFSTDLSLGSVRRLLASMGLRPRKSLAHIFESKAAWFAKEYPRVLELSRKQGAEILFQVATEICWKAHNESTGAKEKESTLKAPTQNTSLRSRYFFLSAINTRGATKFLIISETITDEKYLSFLSGLLDGSPAGSFLFLITSDADAHLGETVTSYIERNAARLKVFTIASTPGTEVESPLSKVSGK